MVSVAEPPLCWEAPAPDGQGPGADIGSDLLGSTPAPVKKRRLQAIQIYEVENMKLHELFHVILCFPRYISCYIAENGFLFGQCRVLP